MIGQLADVAAVMPWAADALCTRTGYPDLWFPEPGGRVQAAEARAICERCPVIAECLGFAMTRRLWHDGSGIWGGTTPEERRAVRRAARRAVAA